MLLCIALVIYLLMSAGERTVQIIQLTHSQDRLEREVRLLDGEYTRLKSERDRLQSTTDVERVAREELNLIKLGETAVIVIPSQVAPDSTKVAPPQKAMVQDPPWRQWWGWLFGN